MDLVIRQLLVTFVVVTAVLDIIAVMTRSESWRTTSPETLAFMGGVKGWNGRDTWSLKIFSFKGLKDLRKV